MRTKLGIILGISALSVAACNYELHDEGPLDDWEWDDDDDYDHGSSLEERAVQTCDAFCVGLVGCGVVEDGAFLSCREACVERYEADEDDVRSGCDCVAEAACNRSEARSCEGDPLPGVWLGDQPGAGSGGASGDGTGGQGLGGDSAGAGGDSGTPCVASCQCAEGEACEEGFCAAPMEPALMCDTDCDCTSGEACMDGFCE